MTLDLRRLIAPRSIALIGAGAWTDAVAAGNRAIGYEGEVWRVHPTRQSTPTVRYHRSVAELPGTPDAAFVAVPNAEVPAVAAALTARGAGGFVCFSAGFSETGTETGGRLTRELLAGAAGVPFLGPNCYGFVNFFDRVAMLPDQVVGAPLERGVALICQSGTIALTLMYNRRSLPIGCLFSVGNQTCLAVEDLIEVLCDDPRVSAFGLYVEGIKDAPAFARAAARARAAGKPIAIVKSGRTAAAARTAHSHTGALAGADSIFDAFCRQAGLARCETLGALCETLKVFHAGGALPGRSVLIMGTSGGDMAMTADVARSLELDFTPLRAGPAAALREQLTDRVAVANPLDMHTYLWFDPPALGAVFRTALHAGYDAVGFMLDCPPEGADATSYHAVIDRFIDAAAAGTGSRAMLISSLPETIGETIRHRCLAAGVAPLQGQREALEALALTGAAGAAWRLGCDPVLAIGDAFAADDVPHTLSEVEGKQALAAYGVTIPAGRVLAAASIAAAAGTFEYPVVLKAVGAHLEHKSELGGVVLGVRDAVHAAAAAAGLAALSDDVLVEQMVGDAVAEVLVGITVDPQFGQALMLGAGGVLAELLADTVTLLPPWSAASIGAGLERLGTSKLLDGFRGRPPGDVPALIELILGVTRYASAHVATLLELDVNPVIVRPLGSGAIAVDTLIRHRRRS